MLAQIAVRLTAEQIAALEPLVKEWLKGEGIVFASLGKADDLFITFRQLPPDLSRRIIETVENYEKELHDE